MLTIYHNAHCSKSREGLEMLKESGTDFEIREYLKTPFTEDELEQVLKKLKMEPVDILRTEEKLWKENYKGKTLSKQELIEIMIANPKLIQRPIVVKDEEAVLGRPVSNILRLWNS